jgi:hypothetical protein
MSKLKLVFKMLFMCIILIKNYRYLEPGKWVVADNTAFLECLQNGSIRYPEIEKYRNSPKLRFFVFTIKMNKGGNNWKAQIVLRNREKNLKFFDLQNSRVYTSVDDKYFNQPYTHMRRLLKEFINIVEFEFDLSNSLLIEPYITGVKISELHKDVIASFVYSLVEKITNKKSDIIENSQCSANYSQGIASTEKMKEIIEKYFLDVNHDPLFRRYLLENLNLVPSITHGDLSESNIIFDGVLFHIIDVDERRMAYRPLWYDLCYLINRLKKLNISINDTRKLEILIFNEYIPKQGILSFNDFLDFFDWFSNQNEIKYPFKS